MRKMPCYKKSMFSTKFPRATVRILQRRFISYFPATVNLGGMLQKKWRESKQQPALHLPGHCLYPLHICSGIPLMFPADSERGISKRDDDDLGKLHSRQRGSPLGPRPHADVAELRPSRHRPFIILLSFSLFLP